MIRSMTAFARDAIQDRWGNAVWELRAVNHRYLELFVRLPEELRELEPEIRDRIRQQVQRGKVECFLKYQPNAAMDADISVNAILVKNLALAADQVNQLVTSSASANVMDILAWPGVLQIAAPNVEVVHQAILKSFDRALKGFVNAREQEGKILARIIEERLVKVLTAISTVKRRLPTILENQRKKILERFEDIKLQINPERLEQELVLIAQRIDVNEEIDRLEIHIAQVKQELKQGGAVGRRLDFLMQELNREANTLAAKSTDSETSSIAVELKVLIEQMREQVQNIE